MIKDILVKLIPKPQADLIVKRYHYSGKVTQNSQLNFGIFLKDNLLGAAQFGPSIDKRRMGQSLGIGMNESIELNRLAISDKLGKNAESRVLGICLRMIKKQYPHIRCVVSFADACQCGDGTIYRAANFRLHSFKKNTSLLQLSDEDLEMVKKHIPNAGRIVADKPLNDHILPNGKRMMSVIAKKTLDDHVCKDGKYLSSKVSSKPLIGYQMKYIYYFDKELEAKHPHVPFDKIPDEVRMYKGEKGV